MNGFRDSLASILSLVGNEEIRIILDQMKDDSVDDQAPPPFAQL
jgi:hypothetical protein